MAANGKYLCDDVLWLTIGEHAATLTWQCQIFCLIPTWFASIWVSSIAILTHYFSFFGLTFYSIFFVCLVIYLWIYEMNIIFSVPRDRCPNARRKYYQFTENTNFLFNLDQFNYNNACSYNLGKKDERDWYAITPLQ